MNGSNEQVRPPLVGPGDARRAALNRRLRSLRWGTVVLGAAATAVFSGLAMHQSTATASTPTTQQTQSSSDAPSQSLFGANSGFSQVGSAATGSDNSTDSGSGTSGFGGRTRHRSGFGGNSGDTSGTGSTDPFGSSAANNGSANSSGSSSDSGSSSVAPASPSPFGGRVHVRSSSS